MADDEELELAPAQPEEKERDELLVGYIWSKRRKRFVSVRTGKPISEAELQRLFKRHIADAEDKMSAIATAFHEGRISPAVFVERMATEQRRHTVQSVVMAKGGFDEMDAALLIALALLLRETNQRIVGTAHDVLDGKVSLPQLLNRVEGYVGEGRKSFFQHWKETVAGAVLTGQDTVVIARRLLHPFAKHCKDCPYYHSLGWGLLENTVMPGFACQCGGHCRCRIIERIIPRNELEQWVGTFRQ